MYPHKIYTQYIRVRITNIQICTRLHVDVARMDPGRVFGLASVLVPPFFQSSRRHAHSLALSSNVWHFQQCLAPSSRWMYTTKYAHLSLKAPPPTTVGTGTPRSHCYQLSCVMSVS